MVRFLVTIVAGQMGWSCIVYVTGSCSSRVHEEDKVELRAFLSVIIGAIHEGHVQLCRTFILHFR